MSAQDWPVGTVATATVRGVEGVRVIRLTSLWYAPDGVPTGPGDVEHALCLGDVTDVRPLVVLDLDDTSKDKVGRGEPAKLVAMLREAADDFWIEEAAALARRVAEQIEAQTMPPRIPEPGWGEKVRADHKVDHGNPEIWVRARPDIDARWVNISGYWAEWSDLVDPVLVRPGIEEGS